MKTLHAARRFAWNAAALAAAFCFVPALAQAPAAAPVPQATAYVSIGDKPAASFDSPSQKGVKQFIYSRFHPLEVLVRVSGWTKVRDAEGGIGWIENSALGARRFAVAQAAATQVRAAAQPAAPVVFEAERGVLLEITGAPVDGWLPVVHRDGQAGFVRTTQVWGQ
ncbi:MAG: hypothetical protein JNK75_00440 [Betaproteobacteria bacterium]|nr:hypothetical protein [Betaproteobacteria bacterium]